MDILTVGNIRFISGRPDGRAYLEFDDTGSRMLIPPEMCKQLSQELESAAKRARQQQKSVVVQPIFQLKISVE